MRKVVFLVVAVLAAVPTVAFAGHRAYVPKAGHRCHAHYVRTRVHKRVECVYAKPRSPSTTTPTAVPSLAVHLDPEFTQNPGNPLDVTFSYSASATLGESPDPNLPAGVLEFFSDGLLACSTNVGGTVDGSTCEVVYSAYGDHTTDVVYDSGTNSATTGPQTVTLPAPPPPPTIAVPAPAATTTVATVTQTGCSQTFLYFFGGRYWTTPYPPGLEGGPLPPSVAEDSCAYTVTGLVTDASGPLAQPLVYSVGSVLQAWETCTTALPCAFSLKTPVYQLNATASCPGISGSVTATFAGDQTDAASSDTQPLPADSLCG